MLLLSVVSYKSVLLSLAVLLKRTDPMLFKTGAESLFSTVAVVMMKISCTKTNGRSTRRS